MSSKAAWASSGSFSNSGLRPDVSLRRPECAIAVRLHPVPIVILQVAALSVVVEVADEHPHEVALLLDLEVLAQWPGRRASSALTPAHLNGMNPSILHHVQLHEDRARLPLPPPALLLELAFASARRFPRLRSARASELLEIPSASLRFSMWF